MYNNVNNQTTSQSQQPTYMAYQMPQQTYTINRPLYQQAMQQPFMGIKGRPVASIEEARASIIDFDGSIFYFPDLANKRIYTKQINVDGTAILNMYELKEIPVDNSSAGAQYVTREEFEAVINQLRQTNVASQAQQSVPVEPVNKKPAGSGVALNF